jgi:hypothetical protein
MSYQIQSKSDLSTGATLVVRIPESELDKKALYTVLADTPSFILPFRFKNVDGDIEFTYLVGARNKLQYSYGSRNAREYTALWSKVLSPLLVCNDWFMNPFSFVLQTDYLYYDKTGGEISYVYIPSVCECSGTDALKRMATELAEKCPADNSELEIKALRAIMQGFNPKDFLQMLNAFQKPEASVVPVPASKYEAPPQGLAVSPAPAAPAAPVAPEAPANVPPPQKEESAQLGPQPASGAADDIVINLHGGKEDKKKQADKGKPKGGGLFGGKFDKKKPPAEQPNEQPKPNGGLFGKKKPEPQPMIMGAAAEQPQIQPQMQAQRHSVVQPVNQHTDVTDEVTQFADGNATQLEESNAKFRLVGSAPLPAEILVSGCLDRPFVIGRFDISVGRKQADFEFDKSTNAVSRRHAAIEYAANGYSIIDLSSSAGTFVNGQRLTPNVPYELTFGARVSFGTSGADYVFEG